MCLGKISKSLAFVVGWNNILGVILGFVRLIVLK